MNIYHAFVDLRPGVSDLEFAAKLGEYMDLLENSGKIEGWRLLRRKLGLAPEGMGEFHIMIEVHDLAQLDKAFTLVASRDGEVEEAHYSVNSLVKNTKFALYRDFPDAERKSGSEKF